MLYVIGADEVGKGALAGECFVGAVMAPRDMRPVAGVRDSKKCSPAQRESLFRQIKNEAGIHYRTAKRSASRIDEIGINGALAECFREAITGLIALEGFPSISHIYIDGRPFSTLEMDFLPIETDFQVKGDDRNWIIGAASIIAKAERDAHMTRISEQYPVYGWSRNKGYGSEDHIQAIMKHGLSPLHRATFCRNINSETRGENKSPIFDIFAEVSNELD